MMNWLDRFRKQRPEAGRREGPAPIGTKLRVSEGNDSTIWTKGQSILGEYTVEGVLGEGGMGTVYLLVRSHFTGQRFAVKKTKFRDETIQRNFLRELQLWLDLPEHPHLVACRFFRTIDEELAIFAEYVEGGALTKWIAERGLKELPHILDVAIQFAWGLHALHEQGLVHQDVKPSNVLLTGEGLAKVSDFGLARARAAAGERPAGGGQGILLSCGGMTEAYCSPEQAAYQALTSKTDIWSWGVSVLEMFTGGVTWANGVVADQALDAYVDRYGRAGVGADGLPLMPVEMVAVLRRCFRPEPQDRWGTMLEVAELLREIYRQYRGSGYPRETPASLRASESRVFIDERRTITGVQWPDPQPWLAAALKADGRDPAEAGALMSPREGSRRAQAVADLAAYDAAQRIYERLVDNGRTNLRSDLARLCGHKALVHGYLADAPGAVAACDRALAILERLVNQEGRRELANDLAVMCLNKGSVLWRMGELAGAVAAYDQALAIQERLVNQEGRWELADSLARTYMNKGTALRNRGDLAGAVVTDGQALAIWDRLVNKDGRGELANYLAMSHRNKGNSLFTLGDLVGAVAAYDEALAVQERLVNQEGQRELANDFAKTYMNKALALANQGNLLGAVAGYDQALAIQERLVNQDGRRELADGLALTYMNKGAALSKLGDLVGAVAAYDYALAIQERLVNLEGRRELANDLAQTYMSKGLAMLGQGNLAAAVAAYDQALAIQERLVNHEGRRELANDLALTYLNKAAALRKLGDLAGAVALCDQAIAIRERLVNQEGRRELASDLANTYVNKGVALGAQGDSSGAVAAYDQALAIQERLVNQEGRVELRGDLAKVQLIRADLLADPSERVAEGKRALSVLEEEARRTGRADLKRIVNASGRPTAG
jgi:serine/threonine protein kinase/tetratricopeptide (TPR) repeat protein